MWLQNINLHFWSSYSGEVLTVAYPVDCRRRYFSLAAQISFIQISGDIYIFFFPKSNQNCFHVMFQPVFTPFFELKSSVRFIRGYWFWCFLNLFTIEVINSRNILACVKNYLNVNVKTFPRGLDSILLTYRLPAIIWYLLREKQFLQTKPWIRQRLNTNNIPSNDISMLRRACPSILFPVTNTYFSRKLTWWGNQKKML